MKCFVHGAREAVAACRKCGKGMCSNCSAYSNHSGICPECRKAEFEAERTMLIGKKKTLLWGIVGWSFLTAVLIVTVVGWIFGVIAIVKRAIERGKTIKRIEYLTGEIEKLNKALSHHGEGVL